jgi:hypothetical protein
MIPAPAEVEKNIKNAAADNVISKYTEELMIEDYKSKFDKLTEKLIFLRDCL